MLTHMILFRAAFVGPAAGVASQASRVHRVGSWRHIAVRWLISALPSDR